MLKKVEDDYYDAEVIGPPTQTTFDAARMRAPSHYAKADDFKSVMRALFTKEAAGDAAKFITTGESAETFKEITRTPVYYPYWECRDLTVEHGGFYADLVRSGMSQGDPLTLIELGSGPASEKTFNILKAIQPDNYVDVEGSFESLLETMEMVYNHFPEIKRYFRTSDFNSADMEKRRPLSEEFARNADPRFFEDLPQQGRRIIVQFGATLGNMPGFPWGEMPRENVLSALQNYRRHMKPGDILILGIDQNQDEETIKACYGDQVHEKLAMQTLKKVPVDLDTVQFDPSAFAFKRYWNPNNHLHALGWEAKHDTAFKIGGSYAEWKKGEFLSYANGYRYPQEFMNGLYEESQLKLIKVNRSPQERMSHQVLRAV